MFALTNIHLVLFFYFNYFFAIPNLYFKRKLWQFALAMLVFIVPSLLLLGLEFKLLNLLSYMPFQERPFLYPALVFRHLAVFMLSLTLRMYQRWKQSEADKNKAELQSLKAQINPHFLFNTLNGIYMLAVKKSDQTPDAISKLSEIMRYVISDAQQATVPLEKEIAYIQNFVDLQRLRLTASTSLAFNIAGSYQHLHIEPLLLISFVENAFKYGLSTERQAHIDINLLVEGNTLSFQVKNDKASKVTQAEQEGIGLKNTLERLEKAYPQRFQLNIDDKATSFSVELKLEL
jgi:LytS/YehU family sensor histidine kinase